MSWKHLFSRALGANPDRLHFAAHSHHLWPDASFDGQVEAWNDAARLADLKWERVMGDVWAAGQRHIADELRLPDPKTVVFSANTHDFIIRIFSALPNKPVRVLATDGEFHAFRRQMARWVESGDIILETVAADRLIERAQQGEHDLIFASHVLFNSGTIVTDLESLAALARPEGPWVVIDGYHSFMAIETDLAQVADRIFYTSGGYKYAMAGEGLGFLHAPPGFAPRPAVTGWFAEFDDLKAAPGAVGYADDARRFLGATFDSGGLYRFNAVRAMMAREGLTTRVICDHVTALQHRFISGSDNAVLSKMRLLNPPGNAQGARFLAYDGQNAQAVQAALEARNVITDVRGTVLRIGFAPYHVEDDVDQLLGVIAALN
jgi:selenocysteine lyase/cysteine desulfurase